jgi:hypothetical protein
MNDLDRDIAKFYARHPGVAASLLVPEEKDPEDMGSISWEDALNLDIKTVEDLDFMGELMPTIRKRLVWDIVPDEKVVPWSKNLGINPGSEEGNVIEQADAERRRRALLPFHILLQYTALQAGDVLTRAKMLNSGNYDSPGDVLIIDEEHDYTQTVHAGVLAVIANLLDLGVLAYGKAITGE